MPRGRAGVTLCCRQVPGGMCRLGSARPERRRWRGGSDEEVAGGGGRARVAAPLPIACARLIRPARAGHAGVRRARLRGPSHPHSRRDRPDTGWTRYNHRPRRKRTRDRITSPSCRGASPSSAPSDAPRSLLEPRRFSVAGPPQANFIRFQPERVAPLRACVPGSSRVFPRDCSVLGLRFSDLCLSSIAAERSRPSARTQECLTTSPSGAIARSAGLVPVRCARAVYVYVPGARARLVTVRERVLRVARRGRVAAGAGSLAGLDLEQRRRSGSGPGWRTTTARTYRDPPSDRRVRSTTRAGHAPNRPRRTHANLASGPQPTWPLRGGVSFDTGAAA